MQPIKLKPPERARADVWRLVGQEASAAPLMGRIEPDLDTVADQLAQLHRGARARDRVAMRDAATGLGMRASALGLNRIARVARTVTTLCDGGDDVALAANVARLHRLVRRALKDIWSMNDVFV